MLDDAAVSAIEFLTRSPLKNASVETKEDVQLSSWGRLQKLNGGSQETYEPISATKSASEEEPQLSSWARIHKLRS